MVTDGRGLAGRELKKDRQEQEYAWDEVHEDNDGNNWVI
jgi:hypothetical protein